MTATERAASARRMRNLVTEGEYAGAQQLLESYCRAFAEELKGRTPGDPAIRQLEREWRELVDDTRRRVLAGRAHTAVRLARLLTAPPVYGYRGEAGHTWQYLA